MMSIINKQTNKQTNPRGLATEARGPRKYLGGVQNRFPESVSKSICVEEDFDRLSLMGGYPIRITHRHRDILPNFRR